MIYLDNAATPPVTDYVKEFVGNKIERFGNPSSIYTLGVDTKSDMCFIRNYFIDQLNGHPYDKIIFTSGGTEADNMIIRGIASRYRHKGNHIITSKIEHPAVLNTCKSLEKQGYRVTYLDVDSEGFIDLKQLREAICKDTILITIMYANNEIGTIQPVYEIGQIAKEFNIPFHTDAVQAFGYLDIDVKKCNIAAMSTSGHKIHGFKGIGFLYLRSDIECEPLIYGGGQQEGYRSGTENMCGIYSMYAAHRELVKNDTIRQSIRENRDYMLDELKKNIEFKLNGTSDMNRRLPGNINISIKEIYGEVFLALLETEEIYVSTGSACSSSSDTPSHVLLSIGCTEEETAHSIRITLGTQTTKQDIDRAVSVITRFVNIIKGNDDDCRDKIQE